MITHVYFDLDGTLTDPYEGITKCILYALDELGFPHPDDDYLYGCIGPPLWDTFPEMVGDRRHDLAGAVANNMTPIGVAYGYGSVEELESAGATAIASSPGDLPGLLG